MRIYWNFWSWLHGSLNKTLKAENICIGKTPILRRYVVCRGLKPGSDAVREYLFRVNLKLNQLRDSDTDVTDVVPLSIIKEDTDFYHSMVNSNER